MNFSKVTRLVAIGLVLLPSSVGEPHRACITIFWTITFAHRTLVDSCARCMPPATTIVARLRLPLGSSICRTPPAHHWLHMALHRTVPRIRTGTQPGGKCLETNPSSATLSTGFRATSLSCTKPWTYSPRIPPRSQVPTFRLRRRPTGQMTRNVVLPFH
jgi:hypothetical protein